MQSVHSHWSVVDACSYICALSSERAWARGKGHVCVWLNIAVEVLLFSLSRIKKKYTWLIALYVVGRQSCTRGYCGDWYRGNSSIVRELLCIWCFERYSGSMVTVCTIMFATKLEIGWPKAVHVQRPDLAMRCLNSIRIVLVPCLSWLQMRGRGKLILVKGMGIWDGLGYNCFF